MKKMIILTLLISQVALSQPTNSEAVPDFTLSLLNASSTVTSLSALKGKVVVIEFWATWCGACISAMPHLNELQAKFPDKLRIISVSSESPQRIRKFLARRPSNIWFASDTADIVADIFPHQLIPHTVVISTDSKLVSNTSPELLTEEVIEKLSRNQPVTLTEKKDVMLSYEQLLENSFHADDSVSERFMIQPSIKGAPGFSTTYLDNKIFNGRRLTAINCDISTLYRIAFGDFPYHRTVDKIPAAEKKSYCLDIIVKDKGQLQPRLQKELTAIFNISAVIKNEIKDVYVLKVVDNEKLKTIPLNTSGKRTYYARHGEVDQQGMTLADLATYLETFGVTMPVIDETHTTNKYDIKFSFQPEDPLSLTKVLAEYGLVLVKARRPVATLYLEQRS
jgi:uncharacterized protein (TIGR03435 family)